MAGVACVEHLLKSPQVFDITIFGHETYGNYDRLALPSVLAGERDFDSIVLNDIEWYQEHGIRTRLGIRVEEIDRSNRAVRSSDGDWTSYDKLILATGAIPVIPPVDGLDKPGVFVFRTLDDTRKLVEAAAPEGARAVVIGGWLGVEAARSLRKRGCEVTMVHWSDSSLERRPEEMQGLHPERQLKAFGIQVMEGCDATAILGGERVESVRFTNGDVVGADIVVIAAGFRPNTWLARNSGLEVNRGIVVNSRLETSDSHICAVGACTEINGQTFDYFPPLLEQAQVLAANLVGDGKQAFTDLESVLHDLATSPLHHRAE
jgi:nitrite reductase [NAD(P)H] large subunit